MTVKITSEENVKSFIDTLNLAFKYVFNIYLNVHLYSTPRKM